MNSSLKLLLLGIAIPISFRIITINYAKEPEILAPVTAFIEIPTPTPTNTPTPTTTPTKMPTRAPTATPRPTTAPVSGSQLDGWFDSASREYGVDRNKLWSLAVCESQLQPDARNKYYGGLYQYAASSWQSIRRRMGRDQNPDLRFSAEEAIKTAAFHISISGFSSWPYCSGKL